MTSKTGEAASTPDEETLRMNQKISIVSLAPARGPVGNSGAFGL
jgi:hypothetical protein